MNVVTEEVAKRYSIRAFIRLPDTVDPRAKK
jgi:hypothetical protein